MSSGPSLGGARRCRLGVKCHNPKRSERPTHLKEGSLQRGYCCYCERAGVTGDLQSAQSGQLDKSLHEETASTPLRAEDIQLTPARSQEDLGAAARNGKLVEDSPLRLLPSQGKNSSRRASSPPLKAANKDSSLRLSFPKSHTKNQTQTAKSPLAPIAPKLESALMAATGKPRSAAARQSPAKAASSSSEQAGAGDEAEPEGGAVAPLVELKARLLLEPQPSLSEALLEAESSAPDQLPPAEKPAVTEEARWDMENADKPGFFLKPLIFLGENNQFKLNNDPADKLLMLWTNHIENILPEDLFLYGYKVRLKVRAFFQNPRVTKATKKRLADFLSQLDQPDILEIYLASTILEGQARVEQLWNHGFAGLGDSRAVQFARAASQQCQLHFDERFATLTARYLEAEEDPPVSIAASGRSRLSPVGSQRSAEIAAASQERAAGSSSARRSLAIYANPVFSSCLTDASFAAAVAHEFYHHRDNHNKTVRELVARFQATSPRPSLDEQERARELAEWAIDCIANEAVGIDRMELLLSPHEEGAGRRLLALAAAGGGGVQESTEGKLFIALQTRERCQQRFNVLIKPTATPQFIFQTLLEADKNDKKELPKAT